MHRIYTAVLEHFSKVLSCLFVGEDKLGKDVEAAIARAMAMETDAARRSRNQNKATRILKTALVAALFALGGCGSLRWHSDEYYRQQAADDYVTAELAIQGGDDDVALETLQRVVRSDPQLSVAHAAIGDIYLRRDELESAATAYESAVAVNAWNFRNHYNCGFLHQTLADESLNAKEVTAHLTRSVELYTRAALLDGNDYDTHLNLGVCCYLLKFYQQAEAAYKRAMEIDPDLPESYANLGLLYDSSDRYFDAMEMYNKSLELDGDQPQVLMNLAAIQNRSGKNRTAMANYMRAYKLQPGSAAVNERLGYCNFQQGLTPQAIEFYNRAIAIDSEMAIAYRGLGVVLMSEYLKDKTNAKLRQRAIANWHKSLELDGDQDDLKEMIARYSASK